MYPIPQDAKDALTAPSRQVTAEVTLDITDVTAYDDVKSITASPQAPYGQYDQITNRNREASYKTATYEDKLFSLSGGFSFADSNPENNGETGFVSSVLSDADSIYTSPPTLTVEFNFPHSSAGLTITFDRDLEEYASDFTITAYNSDGGLITTANITDNTDIICQAMGQLSNYTKLTLTINKWCKPYRRVRILEVDFGVVKVYSDKLIRCNMIEEMDMTAATVPSAEFSFEVDNSDRVFNILNPTGFYKYLQERQIITPVMSVDVNGRTVRVPLGKYYLKEWTSNEGSLTATLKGRDVIDYMSSIMYENTTPSSVTLGTFARTIFTVCGIVDYYVDPHLDTITTNGLVKRTDCRTVLQMIAIAGTCKVYRNRSGQVRLVKEDSFSKSDDRIDFDNMYTEPEIRLLNNVKSVDVTYWTNLDTSVVTTVNSNTSSGDALQLTDNTLINTSARATAVGNWILSQSNGFRAAYNISFRGNPAHELGDIVSIENSYGKDKQAFITKQEIAYEGYLQAKTGAKGATL